MLSPTSVLISIISCSLYFGHALSKVCQYVITYDKVSIGLLSILIKVVQTSIQKCITQTKKSKQGPTNMGQSLHCIWLVT